MIKRFTESETSTFEEVTKALNVLVDVLNTHDAFNAEVEEYNKSVGAEPEKKGGE